MERSSPNNAFVTPNAHLFRDSATFWKQGLVNIYLNENWFHNDPNYHYNLRVAITVQDIIVELRDLLKAKQDMIQNFSKTNDPRLTLADYEEERRLIKQTEEFKSNFNPFSIINTNPKLLEYQIDLHGGLRKKEAVDRFLIELDRIKRGLLSGVIKCNSSVPRQHVIKVICGYGHHAQDQRADRVGALRTHFLQLFKSSRFDFAYIEKHGVFLVRINLDMFVNRV